MTGFGPPPSPTVKLSVVDQVTNQIVEMVLKGELRPGQALPINDMASLMGVSHIPVREALRRLESDGLIVYQRGKGAQVAAVSEDDLRSIFRLRRVIEADVGRRSVALLDEPHLTEIEQRLTDLRAAMTDSTPAAVSPAHQAFHHALLPGATPWDCRMLGQLWVATERYLQLYLGTAQSATATAAIIEEHESLLHAANSANEDTFSKALADHVTWSESEILPAIVMPGPRG
ncbi:GntR family transcriptional regulator [Amycolatopsis rhabdoformis]|uniref:GntR family transcriptional regulator n=1 Tax=Amycolatopsis rhabdoformis TaxID=1448059 RepID=A0ABZ1IMC7_9PSEU|nr:GntR family transcriptional regulator [Amycolatopsis rhabdoformis]WSE34699.1 GntR family transcriptional regulator [Amycolatopsis rhabdoformis]